MTDISALSGLRVLVVGLGREGSAVAAYLAGHGFTVTATDLQPAKALTGVAASLRELGVSLLLGGHPLSLLDQADILIVSPGIPLESPFLEEARSRGIPLSTESRLFCHLCPAPIVGITGSSGKTTTTTLAGEILQAEVAAAEADRRKVWVGGNIGRPLITVVDQIKPADVVVMELSSFQLEYFHPRLNEAVEVGAISGAKPEALAELLAGWSPPISAILNITPNHLDRHPTMKHYVRAKRAIIDYQTDRDRLIMNLDNDMTRTIGYQFGDRTRWFSYEAQMAGGAGLAGGRIVLFDEHGTRQPVVDQGEVRLRGAHNLYNVLAACLIAREAGASIGAIARVVKTFTGVEHRLELVRELHGVRYYNDSIATSPERLMAALHSFDEPIVLLAGGRDKHLPWAEAARFMIRTTRQVILFGEATEIIAGALNQARQEIDGIDTVMHRCANLEEAVKLSVLVAQPGDVVLLSPGCASYDAFRDFAERGEWFKALVLQLDNDETKFRRFS
jgi:UDP-N-acetylmuramoylalanine--D-glutamate ligase